LPAIEESLYKQDYAKGRKLKMAGKKLLLTLNPEIYAELEGYAKANYMTMQELITSTLRKCILYAVEAKKGRPGRPPKVDEPFLEYFSRKK
jgi:hypothetical protein